MNIIDLEMSYLAKVAGGGAINNYIKELEKASKLPVASEGFNATMNNVEFSTTIVE